MSKKTIVGELKDLFVKFGGNADNLTGKETTAEMIDAIEQLIQTDGGIIVDGAITTAKLADGAVTEDKLAVAVKTKLNAVELPAVTAEDNGAVLTVVNGAWAAVAPTAAEE